MKKWYRLILITLVILLLSPIIVVQILYGYQMEFVSYQFTNDYLKFLGSIFSIAFSFFLINIYWKDKEIDEATNQAKNILLNYSLRIINIADKIDELLNLSFNETKFSESQERDNEIVQLIEKMHKVGLAIENTPVDNRALKDETFLTVYTELVWKDLLSTIEKLSSMKNFRIYYDDFLFSLTEVKAISQTIREKLSISNITAQG